LTGDYDKDSGQIARAQKGSRMNDVSDQSGLVLTLSEDQRLSPDTVTYFERLIATYTENIRASDFRSNILIVFIAISVGPLLAFRGEFPRYIPMQLLVVIPLCSIILLLISIYPRFRVIPGYPFFVSRFVSPDLFPLPADDDETVLAELRSRCVAFAKILYWKVFFFKIAIALCFIYLIALLALTFWSGIIALG
jgi:hypothetical protein